MSGLITALALLRATFDEYAGKEGDSKTLTKAELSKLLHKELPGGSLNKAEMEEFFKNLDVDKNGVVDFTEYVTFAATLSVLMSQE